MGIGNLGGLDSSQETGIKYISHRGVTSWNICVKYVSLLSAHEVENILVFQVLHRNITSFNIVAILPVDLSIY